MSSRSNDILDKMGQDFKFKPDFDNGIVYDYTNAHGKKTKVRSCSPEFKGKRSVSLDIYSWSYSIGAVHHYAKFDLGHPNYVIAETGERYSTFIGSDYDAPFGFCHVEFELMRKVDKRDIRHDKEQARFNGSPIYGNMRMGQWTHGFWSEQEAKDAAIKFFKEHFAPGWELVSKYWDASDDKPTVFAVT